MTIEDGRLSEWQPRIGERVTVVPGCAEWASDWVDAAGCPLTLWVAGLRAMAGGGIDVTVSDEWPIRPQHAFTGASRLTDGFLIAVEGQPDQLTRLEADRPTVDGLVSALEQARAKLIYIHEVSDDRHCADKAWDGANDIDVTLAAHRSQERDHG